MIPLFQVFMSPDASDAVSAVLGSGHIAQGEVVDGFEDDLRVFFDAEVLTLNSCTSALDLALHLCNVGPGDEVVTTAQTCTATNNGIVLRGACPVFVDIDPRSGLIDPDDVRRNLSPKTKAIMAVDWAGHPCDYDALRANGVPVIEDAAHAIGTRYSGSSIARSGGDYVCWSFQAIKHLTTGDGGAIKVPRDELERARRLRWFGLDRNAKLRFRFEQDIEEAGFKYHMNDISAAIGRANIPHLHGILNKHQANAAALHTGLSAVPGVELPPLVSSSSWWLFTIKVANPKSFIDAMAEKGVACSPVHARNDRITAFRRTCRLSENLKGLKDFSAHQVSIPVGWWLTPNDIATVIEAVSECATDS